MRFDSHTLVLLTRPADAPTLDEAEAARVQDAHLAYQAGLADEGKLVVAGPLDNQDDERLRGICVLATDTETARALYQQDPAVRAGRLAVEVMTWLVPEGGAAFTTPRMPRSTTEAAGD